MSYFEGLFGPLISLFVVTKGAEAAISPPPEPEPKAAAPEPMRESDDWRNKVSAGASMSASPDL